MDNYYFPITANEGGSGGEYEEFAKAVTANGTRCQYLFYNAGEIENVSIPFDTSGCTNFTSMFQGCQAQNIEPFDTSNGTNFANAFRSPYMIPDIDFSNASGTAANTGLHMLAYYNQNLVNVFASIAPKQNCYMNGIFYNCSKLKYIREIDFTYNTSYANLFDSCSALETMNVVGTIKENMNLQWSSKLDLASAKSVITALEDYSGTEKEFTYSVTFHPNVLTLLEAEGETAPNGGTWINYADSKGWNI